MEGNGENIILCRQSLPDNPIYSHEILLCVTYKMVRIPNREIHTEGEVVLLVPTIFGYNVN